MGLIEDFVSRYKKEYDFYDQSARLVAQLLESSLQSAGIRAIVTFRAKSPLRLESKVAQRAEKKKYQNLQDIYEDIIDLAGVRVALYFPGEREQVGRIIKQLYYLERVPKDFPPKEEEKDQNAPIPSYIKRFSGYWATHYRVRLKESNLNDAQKRYSDALVEIQVASVLMHGWAEVEHDLVYKPLQGGLSDEEYAILDELNGLVIAGEISLERLQRAGESRVAAKGREFTNHYDLAAYLLDKASSVLSTSTSEAVLGRVDILYSLLKRLEKVTPDKIGKYLSATSKDIERRPLSEQIIDQLLTEDDSRYKIYEEVRTALDVDYKYISSEHEAGDGLQGAIGRFLSKWIEVERTLRLEIANKRNISKPLTLTKYIHLLGVFDEQRVWEFDRIRRIRNNLVHGIEIPDTQDIKDATCRLEQLYGDLVKGLQKKSNKTLNRTRKKPAPVS